MTTRTDTLTDAFVRHYDREPAGRFAAPGRVNLIGEHTDYNEGWVLPFAIDRRALLAVAPRTDRTLRIASTSIDADPVERDLDALAPGAPGGWERYLTGVAWAFARRGVQVPGMDILLDSTVPVGSGLSSSAAIECAMAVAINELTGAHISGAELVQICHETENDFVGAPTGILDQSASLLAEEGHALLLDCRDRGSRAVPLPLAENGLTLLVIDTRVEHAHDTGGYRDRVESCRLGAALLGVPTLRHLDTADLPRAARLLDDVTFRRVRHVLTENERVLRTVELLDAEGPAMIGAVLVESHASMRDDYEISCPELDVAVDTALAAGALGARMTGGGFGGSAIALVRSGDASRVEDAVRTAFADAGFGAPEVFAVVPGPGALAELGA